MNASISPSSSSRPRTIRDVAPKMAKASLTDREHPGARDMGLVIQRALSLLGWTIDRLARECQRDRAAVSRWIAGTERAQFDTLWTVEEMRQPIAEAFGLQAGCEVEAVIRIRRQA